MRRGQTTLIQDKRPISDADLKIPKYLKVLLRVVQGKEKGRSFPITLSSCIVGRGEGSDILIDDDAMSRRHFLITYRNLEFRIEDLKSSNGTFLNGSEVKEYALRNGDRILAGDSMFAFVVERNPQPAPGAG